MNTSETKSPAVAFLATLSADGFLPTETTVEELNSTAGLELPVSRTATDDRMEALGGEVEAFASAYWDYLPDERRTRWAELAAKKTVWPISIRLDDLAPGLDVATVDQEDPYEDALATVIRELFVLPPRARAVRRAEWLTEHGQSLQWWAGIATKLQAEQPALLDLETALLSWFTSGEKFQKTESIDATTIEFEELEEQSAPKPIREMVDRRPDTTSASRSGASVKGLGWGGIVIGIIVVRVIIAALSSKSTPQTNTYPTYTPQEQHFKNITYTGTEINEFLQYESQINLKIQPPPSEPPRYRTWRLAGRPGAGSPSRATP